MTSLLMLALMTAPHAPNAASAHVGRDFVTLVTQGQWPKAEAMFDPAMTAAMAGGKLKGLWMQLTAKLGAFQQIERVDTDTVQGFRRDTVVCTFSAERAGLRVVVDARGKVAGFFVIPVDDAPTPGEEAIPTPPPWSSAPYVDASRFTERPVEVGSQKLQGALVVPKGAASFPIVVMLSGSGPNDLDESLPPLKVFRDLAEGLGTLGVASLRFEKRTHRQLPVTTVKEEYLDDAAAAIEQAAAVPGVSKVILLGHSLGATIAPRVALGNPKVAGLILLAGSTWNYSRAIVNQLEYQKNLGFGGPNIDTLIAEAKADAKKIDDPALKPGTKIRYGVTGAYFLDLRTYDAVATAAKLTVPLFIAWGNRDLKVIPKDWEGWQNGLGHRPNLTYRTYPGLQHMFSMVGAADVDHVSKTVITDLAEWLTK